MDKYSVNVLYYVLLYAIFVISIIVVFANQKCLDCGTEGDVRLMPKYCHMEPIDRHSKNTVRYHPKGTYYSANKMQAYYYGSNFTQCFLQE